MSSDPAAVRDIRPFLEENIRSFVDLQVLVALVDGADRWWGAPAIARELDIAEGEAGRSLDNLVRRNLLDIKISSDLRYQFNPGTPALRDVALIAVEMFRRDPISLVKVISARGERRIRDFADAFRIRGNDDR